MSNKLIVAAFSADVFPGDKDSNIRQLADTLKFIKQGTDLVIVPELFSTGYTSNGDKLMGLAETNSGFTMSKIHELAKDFKVAVAGSFLARTGSGLSNRAFFVEANGEEYFYDKRHLFSMSSEADLLVKGRNPIPVIRYRGWNIAMIVCYDLRFPVWCRNNGLKYDLMIVPANWPAARRYAWEHLLIARSIENQAYVIGCDRSGEDKFGSYDGMTLATDYCGKLIEPVSVDIQHKLAYYELEKDMSDAWRNNFSPWKDADTFSVEL